MNGAESLVRTLVAGGVDTCFANPGTSEIHIVAALDQVNQIRCVLGLFEGVVTGAADGYARMTREPACTLLHLGPGLANGLANLHNAKKARSGIVNIVGQHATYHIGYNAPLTSDIEGLARPMSEWVHTSPDAKSVAADGAAVLTIDGAQSRAVVLDYGDDIAVFIDGAGWRFARVDPLAPPAGADAHAGLLSAPMPGRVVQLLVAAGDNVSQGQPLMVIEAMKMEHTIAAPRDGTVETVRYAVGDLVDEGAELIALTEAG